ncbi:hypothetical protein BJY52DRAFT_707994 [Lactarius psammicola]|nr:hypothetical protein BJY52DRAFT_707994 [Lactarius psammicola]
MPLSHLFLPSSSCLMLCSHLFPFDLSSTSFHGSVPSSQSPLEPHSLPCLCQLFLLTNLGYFVYLWLIYQNIYLLVGESSPFFPSHCAILSLGQAKPQAEATEQNEPGKSLRLEVLVSVLLVLVLTPSTVALVLSTPSRYYLPAHRCSVPPPAIAQFHLCLTTHLASARV